MHDNVLYKFTMCVMTQDNLLDKLLLKLEVFQFRLSDLYLKGSSRLVLLFACI